LNLDNSIRRVIIMMVREDILRQVLESRGLNAEEVLAEAAQRQQIQSILTRVGKDFASLGLGLAEVTVKVSIVGDAVEVIATGDIHESIIITLTQDSTSSTSSREGKGKGKGSQVVAKLEAAAQKYGLELKDWQRRSIAYHAPQVFKSLLKQQSALAADPDFQEAVRLYREWHPEKSAELPEV
jgi:hypothetical protein